MTELDEVTRRRLDNVADCRELSPIDILRAMIDDIQRGELDCDGLLLVWCKRPAEGEWKAGTYRANLTRDAELVQLELAKERLMDRWLRGTM